MKLYRFELAFMGEMQNVGFLHGLNDIGLDAETERQMLAPFDKLPRKFLGNSSDVGEGNRAGWLESFICNYRYIRRWVDSG